MTAKAKASAAPVDPEHLASRRLDRANRLVVALTELEAKRGAILEELGLILSGQATTNDYVKDVMGAFTELWAKRYKSQYAWRMTEDVPQVKRLIHVLGGKKLDVGAREMVKRIGTYIRSDEPFYRHARHNFGVFVRSVNDLADDALPLAGDEVHAAPVGCRHAPACRTDDEHTRKRSAEMRA